VLALTLLAARGLDAMLASERRAWWGRAAIGSAAAGGLVLLGRDAVAAGWLVAAQPAVMDRVTRGLANPRILQRFVEAAPAAAPAAATDLGLELVLVGVALGALAWARREGAERWRPLANGFVTLAALLPCLALVAPQLRAATGPRASLRTQPAPALARAAAADPLHRAAWFEREWALSQRWSLSDDWVAWRARQVLGLSGAIPADWDFAARSGLFASRAFLRACAVRHVAMPGAGDDTVGTWPDALPRAWFVQSSGDVLEDVGPTHPGDYERDVAAILERPRWDPEVEAIAERGPGRQYVFLDADSLRWERDDPDRLALRVSAASDAFVVVADAFFPGWTARIDGRVVPIYRVDLLFRGVYVPPGAHELTFDYVPEGWALGRGLALAGWLAALALAFVAWRGVPALKPAAARSPASSAAPSGDGR